MLCQPATYVEKKRKAHLANVRRPEVLHSNGSTTVVLQDLIFRLAGTSTVDIGCTRGLLEGRRILAYICPPHVVERASSQAVHAFAVVRSDDDIGKHGAILQDEDCIGVTTLGLVIAGGC